MCHIFILFGPEAHIFIGVDESHLHPTHEGGGSLVILGK